MKLKHHLLRASFATLAIVAAPALVAQTPREQPATATAKDPFVIEDYLFICLVAESGDATLKIHKDANATRVYIESGDGIGGDRLLMLPAAAEKVGKALEATDAYWSKLRGSKQDASETVKAGEHQVSFRQSPEYGFSVSVSDGESFSLQSASFDRKQAKAFAPYLKRATRIAAHVDRVIDGAIGGQ